MPLYLMRHAQRLTGGDASILPPGGKLQANQLAALFPQFALRPEWVAILRTKFPRARQTAEGICRGLGANRQLIAQPKSRESRQPIGYMAG